MKKSNKKMEELQSRREFFKKAAKGAIPFLGAILLSNAPGIMFASEKTPMGCEWGCSNSCRGGCEGTCRGTCRGDCDGSCGGGCKGNCRGACSGTCRESCTGGCSGNCWRMSG